MIYFIKQTASTGIAPQKVRTELRIRRGERTIEEREIPKVKSGTSKDYLSYRLNLRQRMLVTGLLELEPNEGFIKGMKPVEVKKEYNLDDSWDEPLKDLVKADFISKQHRLEIQAGVAYDYYTPMLPAGWSLGDPMPYIASIRVALGNDITRIDTSTPEGELKLDLLMHSGKVARTVDEVNPAEHLYYISSSQEEEEAVLRKYEDKDHAIYNLMSLINKNRLKDIAWILGSIGNGEYTGGMESKAIIKVAKNLIHTTTDGAGKFNMAFNMYQSDKDRIIMMALINRGLALGIIRVRDGMYVVPSFEGKEFDTKASFVAYLLKNEGEGSLRALLMEKAGL